RYKMPDAERGWRVPINPRIGGRELPVGLILIGLVLLASAVINLFTKETATISGVLFTVAFFGVFVVSEQITLKRRAAEKGKLDQFQLTTAPEVGIDALRARAGCTLVPVRDYNTLSQLSWAVENAPVDQDIVVMTVRLLRGPDGGTQELESDEL